MAFALPSAAQVQTSKTATHGEPTHSVQVERGEVVYVSGNDVMIKGEDGRETDRSRSRESKQPTAAAQTNGNAEELMSMTATPRASRRPEETPARSGSPPQKCSKATSFLENSTTLAI